MSDAQKNAPPKGAGCEICQFTGKLLKAASPMFKSYGPEPCPCCYAPPAPAPAAPDVPKDAEARAISAFNLKAADLCISFRIRDDDGRQAIRAALAAYGPVAQGGVITDKQVDAIIQAVMNAAEVEDGLVVACARSPVRAALEAALSPDAKVGGGWVSYPHTAPKEPGEYLCYIRSDMGSSQYMITYFAPGEYKHEHFWSKWVEAWRSLPPPPTTPSTSEGEEHGEA